jgi:predicted nuclease of predicted toxin-antitoxin system
MTRGLLADENFPLPVVNGLVAAGYDVLTVARFSPGISDRAVLDLARNEGRCLLTFDSDFGDLVFSQGILPPPAILYFRIQPVVIADVLAAALRALTEVPDGSIVVVTSDDFRLRRFVPSRPNA